MNNSLIINGTKYTKAELVRHAKKIPADESQPEWYRDFYRFINDWLDGKPEIKVNTSGTTGQPKIISLSKSAMIRSAKKTLAYFELKKDDKALLCLPAKYIAGKMMIVRAMTGELNLLIGEPSTGAWNDLNEPVDFVPVVPLQMRSLLKYPRKQQMIDTILLGGAAIDKSLEHSIQHIHPKVFHSYGMTETITHVAIRQVNGEKASPVYTALEGISFSTDDQKQLIIDTDFLDKPVYTNDIVDLIDKWRFVWRGRMDAVINSGGIKIFPEEVEKKISSLINERFIITGIPDEILGEKVVLVIETNQISNDQLNNLKYQLRKKLDKFRMPREIYLIPQFPLTSTGKIKRVKISSELSSKSSFQTHL
ncbi:MAG: AMP-binding protein [Bacteroidales bacterium]|nr:AMP-binding protein [Bacteroidales bacterium]